MADRERHRASTASSQRRSVGGPTGPLGELWSLVFGAPLVRLNGLGVTGPHPSGQARNGFRPSDEMVYEDLSLRYAQPSDYEQWHDLRERSRDHLTTWEPAWHADEVTKKAFVTRLKADAAQSRAGRRYAFLIFDNDQTTLLGGISLSDIRMGNRRSGSVGYWVGDEFKGQGVATRAMAAMMSFAFERLALNRIEAACQPGNLASLRLLSRSGFQREGLAINYLKINGDWRDHEIWACTRARYKTTE